MSLREQSIGSVLIIDDEYSMRRMLCRFFETQGRRVVSVSNGAAAVRKLKEDAYSLALVDVNIGKENGLALAARLREMNLRLRIIIMSGNPAAADAAQAAGFVDFLEKPYILDGLKDLLGA